MSKTVLHVHVMESTMKQKSFKNKNNFKATIKPNKKQLTTFKTLNIKKLNNLIKYIDKSWTLPKLTLQMESIGSNFQVLLFKKKIFF